MITTHHPSRALGRILRAVTLAVVGLTLAACGGGGGGGGDESAADVVSRAFGKGDPIRSARLDVGLKLTGAAAGGGQALDLKLSGPYATEDDKTRFDLKLDLGEAAASAGAAGAGELGIKSTGGTVYLVLGGQAFTLPDELVKGLEDPSDAKKKGDDEGISLSSLGIDPSTWLKDPKVEGDEELRGEDTTHVRSDVDLDRLATDLQRLLDKAGTATSGTAQAKEAADTVKRLKTDVQDATIDVWAAEGQGSLRRMTVDMKLKSGAVVLDFGLSEIGRDVKVEAPKDAAPIEQLLSAINAGSSGGADGTTGGTGGSTGGSGGSGSSGGSDAGATLSEHERCIAAAGQDIDKLQACASLGD
ncbi:MAG: hypothetical protein M0P31_12175 [Solirubrobacteraceae bacterium]|nr:hypothetical protein [Solirubrobacteraceae bacterium]